MDLIADQYNWGDHAARHLQQMIKDAVGPNGILSPGKLGGETPLNNEKRR